jgi:hypothetical protein
MLAPWTTMKLTPKKIRNWIRGTAAIAMLATAITPTTTLAAELLAGIAENGRLVLFSSDSPSDVKVIQVTGLPSGESILGIDLRPATGEVYALGSSSRLFKLDPTTGHVTAVGAGPFSPALSGTSFGFDFNPTVDRIRIVSNTGQDLRAHPDTGAIVAIDGTLAYAPGDVAEGVAPRVAGAGYINSDNDPATGTVLYDIDTGLDTLVMQNPPNAGTLVTIGWLGIDVDSVGGFDVAVSTGTAYAALVESGQPGNSARASLYAVNLATGVATSLGAIRGPKPLTSLTALGWID